VLSLYLDFVTAVWVVVFTVCCCYLERLRKGAEDAAPSYSNYTRNTGTASASPIDVPGTHGFGRLVPGVRRRAAFAPDW